jgi:DNA-binding CsgD family transcriptional regulator
METNLVERPVTGSTVLSLRPISPKPRAAWTRTLPVATSAPEQARHETAWFLRKCRDTNEDLIQDAVLLISELVTNAYLAVSAYDALAGQAPGATVDFSLRLFDDHLLIEVIDTSSKVPTLDPHAMAARRVVAGSASWKPSATTGVSSSTAGGKSFTPFSRSETTLGRLDMTAESEPGNRLTDRELMIVRLVANGRTSSQIAKDLDISPSTVDAHVRKVYAKTGMHTRPQLAQRYQEGGL